MKKIIAFASAAVLGLGLAACDGANENAMEDTSEQNAEMVDDQADPVEGADMMTDEQSDAMVDEAEDTTDAMEVQDETMGEAAPAE